MELRKSEYNEIKGLWDTWRTLKDTELEAVMRRVDSTEWMDILRRLRQLGLQEEAQQPYLDILLQNGMRFRMTGEDAVSKYCKTNTLPESATCTLKSRINDVYPIELNDYDIRIKLKREQSLGRQEMRYQEILLQWPMLPKSFRYIRRYTFTPPKGSGARFDLSIVRQSPYDTLKQFARATTFQEPDILKRPLTYEVEIEATREDAGDEPMALIGKIGQVLQGKQKSFVVLRKPAMKSVLDGIKEIFGQNNKFPGPKSVNLEKKNLLPASEAGPDTISLLSLRGGYNVTDKADGLRAMLYVHTDGIMYMVDMNMNVYGTGLIVDPSIWSGTCLDGEWVRQTKTGEHHNTYYAFDIFRTRGAKDCKPLPFLSSALVGDTEGAPVQLESRFRLLQEAIAGLVNAKATVKLPLAQQLSISIKNFKAALPGSPLKQIFIEAAAILDEAEKAPYAVDGLIFTPNAAALPETIGAWKAQFKWKPIEHNTIDFLCSIERYREENGDLADEEMVRTEVRPDTNELVTYKTIRLFVGGVRDPAYKNPRQTILQMQPLPSQDTDDYRPILFQPTEPADVFASICHVVVDSEGHESDIAEGTIRTTGDGQPISNNSIIEMSYDPKAAPGWRWKPIRIRWDKTEQYRRGVISGTLNAEKVAESIWASIHDSISLEQIRTGSGIEDEITVERPIGTSDIVVQNPVKQYVAKQDYQNQYKAKHLREFHNWVKNTMLFGKSLQEGNSLLDMACGKGGDLHKWVSARVGWVLAVDLAEDSLNNPRNGAYRRYIDKRMEFTGTPPIVFVQGNVLRPLSTGDAGITSEDQIILRSLYNTPLGGAIPPPFLEENQLVKRAAEKFDVVSCMFALHYFFQDRTSVDGFINNLSESLKLGGFFVGCCFDGETVYSQLKNLKSGGVRIGKEDDTVIWTIEKVYDSMPDESSLPETDAGLGRAIDVNFITIGDKYREYLVNFNYLRARLADIGVDLLTPEEMSAMKLKESTGLFKQLYSSGTYLKERFPMSAKQKEFSFFNRWFIFRRRSFGPLTSVQVGEEVSEGVREPIILPPAPPATRGRGGLGTRGRGNTRGPAINTRPSTAAASVASVPVALGLPTPSAGATRGAVKATRGRGGMTRGASTASRTAHRVSFEF